mmetsp:Transcript_17943/g.30193  ORF Transcript_17943/g.30193 Transcript_17943/m.30193 type:complete len:94 (+) Transcript_17943:198-479(+)
MAFKDVIGLYHFILVSSFVIFLSCDLELDKVDLDDLGNSRIDEIKPLHMAVFRASCATGIFASLIYLTLHPSPLLCYCAIERWDENDSPSLAL